MRPSGKDVLSNFQSVESGVFQTDVVAKKRFAQGVDQVNKVTQRSIVESLWQLSKRPASLSRSHVAQHNYDVCDVPWDGIS
jgi:hypothetical protein